ncbi:MAG TPA: hypothetical protein VLX58_02545, partial [Bryobacteraceae bacterium]|nr:hypothetical protein [Bryobacteraceae bacterium]
MMTAPCCLLAALIALSLLPGQQPAGDGETSFRISVNLVQIDAAVTNSHGEAIRDLTKSDFEVLLDGIAQPITYFSHVQSDAGAGGDPAASAPKTASALGGARLRPDQVARTMVIFVDDLNMSAESVPFVRRGVQQTVEKRTGPGDLTAIVRASAGLGAL